MSDLLQQAMTAIEIGDNAQGRQLLDQVIAQEPNNETAWLMMAVAVEDVQQRRICLERVLSINPGNQEALAALARLSTSPLTPASRGERGNPPSQPLPGTPPAFTPPFTWEGEPKAYGASSDSYFGPLPSSEPEKPADTPLSFDWATESEEPDDTINNIFAAVSKPELASEPLPDTDLSWLLESLPEERLNEAAFGAEQPSPQEPEASPWQEEPIQPAAPLPETDFSTQPAPYNPEDFAVDAEPHMGIAAFIQPEEAQSTAAATGLVWDNPQARTDRLVMLSDKSLIYAHPNPTDIPRISELFAQKKMQRELLGAGARSIKFETIQRLSGNPKGADLTVSYLHGKAKHKHKLQLASPQVRDEVLAAAQRKLPPDFVQSTQKTNRLVNILPPLLMLLIFLGGSLVLYFGLVLLSKVPAIQAGGSLEIVKSILTGLTSPLGTGGILGLGGLFSLVALVWLVISLRKPTEQIVVERPVAQPEPAQIPTT
jgi:hypothetical protein